MDRKEADQITDNVLIADALVRIKTLETILLEKGIFSKEEYSEYMGKVANQILKSILEKAKVPGDLDEIVKNLKASSPQN